MIHKPTCLGAFMVATGLSTLSAMTATRAQGPDPFHCLPPTGQRLHEIAATNLAKTYREEPTAKNKKAMCNRFRTTAEVYAKAYAACRKNTCEDPGYIKNCEAQNDKAVAWRKRMQSECGT